MPQRESDSSRKCHHYSDTLLAVSAPRLTSASHRGNPASGQGHKQAIEFSAWVRVQRNRPNRMRGEGPYNSLLNFGINVIYFLVAGSNSGLGAARGGE